MGCRETGFEKLMLKNGTLKAYLMSSDNEQYYNSPIFGSILGYVQQHPRKCKIKDGKNRVILIVQEIENVNEASELLSELLKIKSLQMQ